MSEHGEETTDQQSGGKDVDKITERLYTTHTVSWSGTAVEKATRAEDQISPKKTFTSADVANTVERLYTTHTKSSNAKPDKTKYVTNEVAGDPLSEEEMKAIYDRLTATQTKSSSVAACKQYDDLKTPGLGSKMLPVIEGLDTRFKDKTASEEAVKEIIQKMTKTQTVASQAKLDNHRHLLYPERTKLMNNVERIENFQKSGALVGQAILQRREKWYN